MRTRSFIILITCLALALAVLPAGAQPVTAEDARSVAQNWVALTIRQQGDWGGSPTAQIGDIQEFRQGDRLIGYFCPVSPQGFIVVSLRRELAPVKVYSDTSSIDPESDEGMPGLIKEQMAAIVDKIEQDAGPVGSVSSAAVTPLMGSNFLNAWDVLDTGAAASGEQIQAIVTASDYQTGGVMLTTQWHQLEPYYNEIPAPPSPAVCNMPHCTVGCGATAGAQIMAYWDWPPNGIGTPYSDAYDWPNMADQYLLNNNRWEDGNGNPITPADIDAVAELSHEYGQAVGMEYCYNNSCGSNSYMSNFAGAYKNMFRYSTAATMIYRTDYSPPAWFTIMKDQFNRNWPVHYRVRGHFIVGDGWQEINIGGSLMPEYHMNYGWQNTASNAWYTIDNLTLGGINEEMMVLNIYPAPALGWWLSGTYPVLAYPYRYFDADAWGDSATFSAGQNLQFLPGITATCNSGTGTAIRFVGTGAQNTRLFTRGDTSKGAIIRSGTITLKPGGSVRLP